MNRKISFSLSASGLDKFIQTLDDYENWLKRKCEELAERLAVMGATQASLGFARSVYTGDQDFAVTVEHLGEGHYAIKADGSTVLFVEFGTGITYGAGHPEAAEHGMGPGTYPDGKGHWNDPRGWYLPKDKGGEHTYGNPPNAPMYNAVKAVEEDLARVAREVFSSD